MQLLALPSELLHHVASSLGDGSDLSSFASTCRPVRLATRSLLFRSITVTSLARLESLAGADLHTLNSIREFTLRLEYDFFETFTAACNDPCNGPILTAFAHILLNAPQISTLQIQIPDHREDYRTSPWTQLLRSSTRGIVLGSALARILPANTVFPALRCLHLDGIAQFTLLAHMTPNLTTLSVHMCEGFTEVACRELVQNTLPLLPHLEELAFDPFSMRFVGSNLNVPKAIMTVAPGLRALDLRSKTFDFSAGHTEWRTTDPIDPLDCVPSGSRLRELHLPFAPLVNEASSVASAESSKAHSFDHQTREAELLAVVQLASASPLEKVSWLRADGDEPIEYTIERDAHGIPTRIQPISSSRTPPDAVIVPSGAQGFTNSFASLFATVASSTAFQAAVVMWLLADSTALPLPGPRSALLAVKATLGIVAKV